MQVKLFDSFELFKKNRLKLSSSFFFQIYFSEVYSSLIAFFLAPTISNKVEQKSWKKILNLQKGLGVVFVNDTKTVKGSKKDQSIICHPKWQLTLLKGSK